MQLPARLTLCCGDCWFIFVTFSGFWLVLLCLFICWTPFNSPTRPKQSVTCWAEKGANVRCWMRIVWNSILPLHLAFYSKWIRTTQQLAKTNSEIHFTCPSLESIFVFFLLSKTDQVIFFPLLLYLRFPVVFKLLVLFRFSRVRIRFL